MIVFHFDCWPHVTSWLRLLYRDADMVLTRCWVLQMERGNRELELVVKHPDLPKHSPRRIQNTNPSLVLKPPLSRLHSSRQPKLCTYSSEVCDHHQYSVEAGLCSVCCCLSYLLCIIGHFISWLSFENNFQHFHYTQNTPNLAGYPCPKPCYFSFRQTLAQALLVTCTTYNWFIHYTVIPINYINPVLPGIKEVI